MSFIDSYKKLEKICSEMYRDSYGVSAYIDEMLGTPNGADYVEGWNEDLKKLKHYRWVRNQIAHEPGCSEENMCVAEDVRWIDNFYSRIMLVKDPLALYSKARNSQGVTKPKQISQQATTPTRHQQQNVSQKPTGCFTYMISVMLVIILISNII
ncbi:MAG: hypothetical protein E7270_03310 [Lachnospiraceae bacterium]|nr:hypothetical protein [Lachnospiraceae bacterium]